MAGFGIADGVANLSAMRPCRKVVFSSALRGMINPITDESTFMGQAMLRVQLAEIATFRVTCKKCNSGVIEVPVDRLDAVFDQGACRFCQHRFFPPTGPEAINNLRMAIGALSRISPDLGIEFDVPLPK